MMDRIAAGLVMLLLLGCAAATEGVRPGQSAEANQRDYAACEEVAAIYYTQPLAAEITQGYGGGVPSPLRGRYPPALYSEVPDLPFRAGRGDLVNREDASRRMDREMDRLRASSKRDIALRDCLVAAGFEERPIAQETDRAPE